MIDIDGPVKCPKDGTIMTRVEECNFVVFSYEWDAETEQYKQIDLESNGETAIHFECPNYQCGNSYSVEVLKE